MTQADNQATTPEATSEKDEVTVESLVEEVSIDGMCGVY